MSPSMPRALLHIGNWPVLVSLLTPQVNSICPYEIYRNRTWGYRDVIDLIIKEMGMSQMTEFQRNVALVWNEMKVKAGFVMDRISGKVVGFSSLGNYFNEELFELSQLATHSPLEPEAASHK